MHAKFTRLDERLYNYVVESCTPLAHLERELIEETEALGTISMMQVAPDQATLLSLLVRISGAHRAVEIGTFTGLSALAIARSLPTDGHLLCCDLSPEWGAIARRYWDRAGVSSKITLAIGPAVETLERLPADEAIEFAFIDADKESYGDYYDAILTRMPTGGLIVADNVLWGGSVADPSAHDSSTDAIRAFNAKVVSDQRVEVVMLPVSDGVSLIRKR